MIQLVGEEPGNLYFYKASGATLMHSQVWNLYSVVTALNSVVLDDPAARQNHLRTANKADARSHP